MTDVNPTPIAVDENVPPVAVADIPAAIVTVTNPSKYSKTFWIDLADRAVSTAAQSAIGVLGVGSLGILDIDWQSVAGVVGLATLISVLKAFGVAKRQ